jgi:radical SAM superfamily enzyme YgiQ (UPF0313 family)
MIHRSRRPDSDAQVDPAGVCRHGEVMRRLVLIAPPVLYAPTWWSRKVASKPHLHSLAGYVRDLAVTRIVELDVQYGGGVEVEAFLSQVEPQLALDEADLVGISCWTSLHFLGAVALARRIRRLRPELPIAVGGHHATAMPADFTAGGLFDFVVRGDGEVALRELCERPSERPARAEILCPGPYAMTDPSRIDWQRYPWHDAGQRVLWVCLSRGCPFKCAYCAEPQRGTSWSHYAVADALAILEGLQRTHQPRVICFSDPLFGANRQWTEALLDGIAALGLDTMFWCETRADLLTPSLLEKLRACRFKVDFGLDTGSERMARQMVKSPAPELYLRKAREIIRLANDLDLNHDTYVLFNFPGETPETARETMEFVERLADGDGPASGWVSSQSFFILPGTETYRRMDEYRALYGTEIRHPTWWRETSDHNLLATDVLPSHEYRGRERELRDFQKWQEGVNVARIRRQTPRSREFLRSFYGM